MFKMGLVGGLGLGLAGCQCPSPEQAPARTGNLTLVYSSGLVGEIEPCG